MALKDTFLIKEDTAVSGQAYADAPLPAASGESANEIPVSLPRRDWNVLMDIIGWATDFTKEPTERTDMQQLMNAIRSQIRGKGI
jgi:hypothetical protein